MSLSRRIFLKGAAATGALSALSVPAFASTIKWDLADEYGAQAVSGKASNFFIETMSKKVGDVFSLTYQGSGALGYKSVDHFDAVQDGAVQAAVTLVTQIGGIDPLFDLSSLPFLASTPDEAYLLWKAAREEYAKIFEENDMILLWAMPNPPSGVNAPAPVTSMDAIKGLRIRTYDKNGTETFINAGASPLQVAWSDLIPQLSTGGIDGVLTSADGARQLSIWDYLSDYTELNYAMGLFMCHVNRDAFEDLPENVQAAMLESIDECDARNWEIMSDSIETAYAEMEENGMTVTRDTEVPAEVFAALQEAAADVKAAWLERTGARGEAVFARFEELKAATNG
ncbi:TRAP transporter substrate-binding protein DctP [Celeribacter litoreus]|uniref:TRAP transporter substrate-binding protein DctP n=1 Tax=Celeribacter litoreus TaxID=2876714 RepID=UPI001CCF904E|nr:TRAP transporter substrate-binding protein DctP [Celeribacter litoreus]MCA0044915.1 TRAP transporter substrate-binding protein DctP [Celeribacter litoreus]